MTIPPRLGPRWVPLRLNHQCNHAHRSIRAEWGAKRKIKAAPFYLYAFWFILNSALYTTVKHPPR